MILVPIEPVSSWCFIFALSMQIGRKSSPKQFGDKEVSHTNFGGEPKMRFVSTALVLMAIALMMLAMTLVNTTSGP
jgi:hypothetical protein